MPNNIGVMKIPVKPLLLVLVATLLVSCGGKKAIYEGTAEQLHDEVVQELDKKGRFIFGGTNYDKVFEILKEIQIRYTYTPYAALAELRTGDVYFRKREYTQAATEYQNFINNHPGHEKLDYATYRLGLSHYERRAGKDRNYSKTLQAMNWFISLRETYPDSPYAEETQEKIEECRRILAEREIYIGKFYHKKKNYEAAIERFNNVLENYPETRYAIKAAKLLERSRKKLSEKSS